MAARRLFWAALLIGGGALLLTGLGRRDLWQDEAETALLARSVLVHGKPVAFDGLNVVSGETSHEFGPDYVWRWSPWLQIYVVAGAFKTLGEGAAQARLPFALIGLCCLPLTFWWVRRLFEDERLARLSAGLLAVHVPFLLHMRQARWYALAAAAACGLLGFGPALLKGGRRRDVIGAALCAAVLFYANFLVAAALFVAFALGALALGVDRKGLKALGAALALAALLCLPGILLHRGMAGQEAARFLVMKTVRQAFGYGAWTLLWICPLPVFALALWHGRGDRRARFLALSLGGLVLALALGPWRFFRYLVPLAPVGAALEAYALSSLWKKSRAGAVLLGAVLVCTDLLSAPLYLTLPKKLGTFDRNKIVGEIGSPLLGYFRELGHELDACERAAAAYLNANARPGDVVLATYGDLVLQFYTKGLKIVGGFQGLKLPPEPDWIVVQPNILSFEPGKDADVFRFLAARVDVRAYERVPLSCESAMLAACPEPWTHEYVPSDKPALKLLKRIKPRPARF